MRKLVALLALAVIGCVARNDSTADTAASVESVHVYDSAKADSMAKDSAAADSIRH